MDDEKIENVWTPMVLAKGTRVEVEDLPQELGLAAPVAFALADVRPLEEVEREYILSALRANCAFRPSRPPRSPIATTRSRLSDRSEATLAL